MADIHEIVASVVTTDVAIATTTETVAVASGKIRAPRAEARIIVMAFAVVTIGAGGATITPRIQRTDDVAGTVIDDGDAVTVTAAAVEQVIAMADDVLTNVADVEYNLSLAVASATGNSTVHKAGILVLLG